MARELGPQGIHVAHVVIDGAIDTDFIRENFPERYALKDQDGILDPEHIAEPVLDAAPRSRATPGPTSWTCGPGWRPSDEPRAWSSIFDFGSPTAYLAWTQLPRLARETGARGAREPCLLGGVFKATGNRSPMEVPAKSRWLHEDLKRFAARYGVPFRLNPHFPINTLMLMRGALGPADARARQAAALRRCRDARASGSTAAT